MVFDIQRFCVHDGPGLRTTVFFKGCPLRCRWCSNPESQRAVPELLFNRDRCMGCGGCVPTCSRDLVVPGGDGRPSAPAEGCAGCGECAVPCPTAARTVKGRDMSVGEVVAKVLRDASFYASSGGGATLSGGEPFAQPDFAREVLLALREAGVRTAVETTAHARWEDIERCLPLLDHVMVDLKHADDAAHRRWTGVGLETIRRNQKNILANHADALVRIPVVPGFNTDDAAIAAFAAFIGETGATRVELLPYHSFGEGKYRLLGLPYPGADIDADAASADAERLRERLAATGAAVQIGE